MRFRSFGRTDWQVSEIDLGAGQLGGDQDSDLSPDFPPFVRRVPGFIFGLIRPVFQPVPPADCLAVSRSGLRGQADLVARHGPDA
jgi:hypothetical protein